MTIHVSCDQCGAKFEVKEIYSGKRAKCRRCGNVLTIPKAAPEIYPVLDEDEELPSAQTSKAMPAQVEADVGTASPPHVPPSYAPKKASMVIFDLDSVFLAIGLYILLTVLIFLLLIITVELLGVRRLSKPLSLVWSCLEYLCCAGFAVVCVMAILKCHVRYQASMGIISGNPILSVDKYFVGWRYSCTF